MPGAHCVHAPSPSREYVPAPQALAPPLAVHDEPAGHKVHEAAPVPVAKRPVGQPVHCEGSGSGARRGRRWYAYAYTTQTASISRAEWGSLTADWPPMEYEPAVQMAGDAPTETHS